MEGIHPDRNVSINFRIVQRNSENSVCLYRVVGSSVEDRLCSSQEELAADLLSQAASDAASIVRTGKARGEKKPNSDEKRKQPRFYAVFGKTKIGHFHVTNFM